MAPASSLYTMLYRATASVTVKKYKRFNINSMSYEALSEAAAC